MKKKHEKGGEFLGKGKHATLGNKALGPQPKWEGNGENTEQTRPKPMMTTEKGTGTQKHPAKRPQPKMMRFLPDPND